MMSNTSGTSHPDGLVALRQFLTSSAAAGIARIGAAGVAWVGAAGVARVGTARIAWIGAARVARIGTARIARIGDRSFGSPTRRLASASAHRHCESYADKY